MNEDSVEQNLLVAEEIARRLAARGTPAVVIGAVALAAHNYVRLTDDIDLGVNASVDDLEALAEELRAEGYEVAFRSPDADDPLGGVLDVSGAFGLVQVVNFGERFPRVIDDAVREASFTVREGSPLRVVPLPQLVALKLYARGPKAHADIVGLLRSNPEADREALRRLCDAYRLPGLDALLRALD